MDRATALLTLQLNENATVADAEAAYARCGAELQADSFNAVTSASGAGGIDESFRAANEAIQKLRHPPTSVERAATAFLASQARAHQQPPNFETERGDRSAAKVGLYADKEALASNALPGSMSRIWLVSVAAIAIVGAFAFLGLRSNIAVLVEGSTLFSSADARRLPSVDTVDEISVPVSKVAHSGQQAVATVRPQIGSESLTLPGDPVLAPGGASLSGVGLSGDRPPATAADVHMVSGVQTASAASLEVSITQQQRATVSIAVAEPIAVAVAEITAEAEPIAVAEITAEAEPTAVAQTTAEARRPVITAIPQATPRQNSASSPVDRVNSAAASSSLEASIAEYLRLGREAAARYQLSRPIAGSALFYIRKIEALEAGREEAAELIKLVRESYLTLALSERSRENLEPAAEYAELAWRMGASEAAVREAYPDWPVPQ